MSSLQSIMNLDDDQQDASSPTDKKDKDTTAPASGFRDQDPSSSNPKNRIIPPGRQYSTPLSYNSRSTQQGSDPDLGSSFTTQQGRRLAETSLSSAVPSSASLGYSDLRRQSSTSIDSMDPRSYGSAASSSSVGGGPGSGGYASNVPRRPMGTSPGPEVPVRLTPITGRVSRAKKGVPVHICDQCNPPKTFTRAEHLRRHQLSHQKPQYPCSYPDCNRTFYRQDLLSRHELRHTQEGGDPSSPRLPDTPASLEEQMPGLHVGNLPPPNSYSPAPGSISSPRPVTPPPGSTSRAVVSPRPESRDDQYGPSPGHPSSSFTEYALHSGIPIITQPASSLESSPEPSPYSQAPRITPISLYGVAQTLSPSASMRALVEPPELDYSWTSEDSYSTHSELPRAQRHQTQPAMNWPATNTLMPTLFPAEDRQDISTSGPVELMSTPYFITTPYSVSPHLATAPQPPYGSLLSEPLMASFADDQMQLLDPAIAGINHGPSSVRSSSPSLSMSVSGQAADTLVTPAPLRPIESPRVSRQKELAIGTSTADLTMGVLGHETNIANWTGGSQEGAGLTSGQGLTGLHGGGVGRGPALAPPSAAVLNAVPSYLDIYWNHSHRGLPIVHRPSFEMSGEEALRFAMAALATQHLESMEDRIRGSQLHEYAWQEARRCAPGNIQGMQAIVLCEYFARFRGRRPAVKPSKAFESLYSRVVDHSLSPFEEPMGLSASSFKQQQQRRRQKAHFVTTKEQRWRSWLDTEAHRRLLAACFCLDNHAAIYHQQPRAKKHIDISVIPLTGPTDALWEASSIDEWYALLELEATVTTPECLPPLDALRAEDVARFSKLDQASILSATFLELENQRHASSPNDLSIGNDGSLSEDLRTPTVASYAAGFVKVDKYEQAAALFSKSLVAPMADAYVALQHTPLRDLLAVSGDSWVFGQKVLDPPTFVEHQKRLKIWAEGRANSASPTCTTSTMQQPTCPSTTGLEGLSSTKATIYAARTLVSFCDGLNCQGPRPYIGCISTYWTIYVSALIIWAYGHQHNHRGAGGGSSKVSGSGSGSGSPNKGTPMSEEETINWLRAVAAIGQPEHLARVRGRREASAGVVSMVRRMLDSDCVGGRSRLYVDATVVMRKLEEGLNFRWF